MHILLLAQPLLQKYYRMLAEKKKKMRLPQDPNNKNWTEGNQ